MYLTEAVRIPKKRVFISFAKEDKTLRDFLVGQNRNENSPFEFTDMSVKEPWDDSWKTRCRIRIKGCKGVIAIVTKNTKNASGQRWEIKCAYDEGVPVLPIYGSESDKGCTVPAELSGRRIYNWSWRNIENFVNGL